MKIEASSRLKLSAGLSPVLYHITTMKAAEAILKSGEFALKPADGFHLEVKLSGEMYYLSTARSPTSDYIRSALYGYSVIFELDGRKLGQRYKGVPVDYWQDSNQYTKRAELEDRVLSFKSTIPAYPYIRAIHTVANPRSTSLYQIWLAAKKKRIPVYFYRDARSMQLLSPKNRVEYRPTPSTEKEYTPTEYDYKNMGKDRTYIMGWTALWKINIGRLTPYEAIRRTGNKVIKRAYEQLQFDDALKTFEMDLDNAKSATPGSVSRERETLVELITILRTNKINTRQYIERLKQKWYPPRRPATN